jgi:CxxC motif-containing protein
MTELICIVCPRGCHLTVNEELIEQNDFEVNGAGCKRGVEYGRAELTHPVRVLTSTVPIAGALYRRCPVKTQGPIPKQKIFLALQEIRKLRLSSPVSAGQVLLKDLCGTGVDLITTRFM